MKQKNKLLFYKNLKFIFLGIVLCFGISCKNNSVSKEINSKPNEVTAKDILGNPNYEAICYGGYRTQTRDVEPTVAQIKDDLKILAAINIKVLRTYNVHHQEITNLLKAITELQSENPKFEMYVMLGIWIDCKNAWTKLEPIHNIESDRNDDEIKKAVYLTNTYPNIIKIMAVGNEAMVKWAESYYVEPKIILKWVNYLQDLKRQDKLPTSVWITSSDNFASFGGGDSIYHTEDLDQLIKAVDYISMHTYPMHDTHYNPVFWGIKSKDETLSEKDKIDISMVSARDYAISQYKSVVNYMKSIGVNKPVHIGETGWASSSNDLYGNNGSKATDEYKSAKYYKLMREWTNKEKISCFYFEAFDENWKDAGNPGGSENHFGLINLNSQAKYALWNVVEDKTFNGLTRNGKPIAKTYNGNENEMWKDVKSPSELVAK